MIPILIIAITILGMILYYVFYLGPRLNPINKADIYIDQNMYEEAIFELKKILDKEPYNVLVHNKLATLYFSKDEIDQGIIHLEEIVKINKYTAGVDKNDVLKKLARAYMTRNDRSNAFYTYLELLQTYPTDAEALYHVAFITLGQGFFDHANRYFDRLVSNSSAKKFEIYFGAGIACYQNQKTNEAIAYFKEALLQEPHSDIGNIAMAFAQQRRRDYKTALNYLKMVIDNSRNKDALFIAKRLFGILSIQAKKPVKGIKMLEELLEYARKSDQEDEVLMLLYDLGFASIHNEKTEQAYEYWNELYQIDRTFKNTQKLIMILRKEIDADIKQGVQVSESVIDYVEKWATEAFPRNFVFEICGLKHSESIDMNRFVGLTRSQGGITKDDSIVDDRSTLPPGSADRIESLNLIDAENFRIIANRVMAKLGYSVDEILPSYRENDGVDFLAFSLQDKAKTLVWVRRWKKTQIGEIPLRNFAQAINDVKAKRGLFVSTTDLTTTGERALERLSKVTFIKPEQLDSLLNGLI